MCAAFCQWGYRTFIYERLIEDKLGNFVDLCSVTNTSVFVLSNYSYGYYIHGRSVHGEADVGLRQLVLNLEKEKESLVGMRGLASGSDDQVFTMYVPTTLTDAIHRAYDEIGGGNATAGTICCTVLYSTRTVPVQYEYCIVLYSTVHVCRDVRKF